MDYGAAPTYCLFVALVAGAVAGSSGRSGGKYGAVAGGIFFILWELVYPSPLSLRIGPPLGFGALSVGLLVDSSFAFLRGGIWGGLWGLFGGWLGRKMNPPALSKTDQHIDSERATLGL
jgi:hypothetical protein